MLEKNIHTTLATSTSCEEIKQLIIKKSKCSSLSQSHSQVLSNLLLQFSTLFSKSTNDLSTTPLVCRYIDTDTTPPIKQNRNSLNYYQRKELEYQTDEGLANEKTKDSVSPCSSPVLIVAKPDGFQHLSIDYRKLNSNTTKDSFPKSHIQDALDTLHGNQCFTYLQGLSPNCHR